MFPPLFTNHQNLFYRLYQVGQLRLNSCLFNICTHLTKLSLLLPSPPPPSHSLTTSLLTTVAIFLVSYVVLHEMLFEQSSSSSQVCVHVYVCVCKFVSGMNLCFYVLYYVMWYKLKVQVCASHWQNYVNMHLARTSRVKISCFVRK